MADRESTFAGTWRRPDPSGTGRSLRDVQDRASYDQAPAQGMSCAITAPIVAAISGGLWWALIEGGRALIGAIA